MEKLVSEDRYAGRGLYGSFNSVRLIMLLFFRNTTISKVVYFPPYSTNYITFLSFPNCLQYFLHYSLNSIKFCRLQFCVIVCIDKFAHHTIVVKIK